MINIEILKDPAMMLPIEYDKDSCEDAIDKELVCYKELLEKSGVEDKIIERTDSFRKKLKEMYSYYFLGHQNEAYHAFKSALELQTGNIGIIGSPLPKEPLYRARINVRSQDFKNDEMFHIKYKSRGKVQTQRFSFPGLPCLYLGSSSYVCWMELNRPFFDQFQVASIRQIDGKREFDMIDLGLHPLAFYNEIQSKGETEQQQAIIVYLQWWPIMAACSVVVKNEDDPFKPEYIFPQFMLQYLLEEPSMQNYIGIKYLSIKAGKESKKQYESDYRTYTNYVIPIRSSEENKDGFCEELSNEFEIVRNYSGKELQVLTDSIRTSGSTWEKIGDDEERDSVCPLECAKLYATNDVSYLYKKSIFFRIETILNNVSLDKYNDEGKMIITPISEQKIDELFK